MLNRVVPAAAEGLPIFTRREALHSLAAGGATGALAAGAILATIPAEAATADPISLTLAVAIERHQAALAMLEEAGRVQGEFERVKLDRPDDSGARAAFDTADDAFNVACGHEQEAHNIVLEAPIVTLADVRAKAAYLASVSCHIIHDGGTMAALLASMGAGMAMATIPSEPDPMRAAVEEYEAAYALQGEMAAAEDWKNCSAIYAARIGPAEDAIQKGPIATSLAGAIAAVRYVANDRDWIEEGHAAALRAALTYFEGRV